MTDAAREAQSARAMVEIAKELARIGDALERLNDGLVVVLEAACD